MASWVSRFRGRKSKSLLFRKKKRKIHSILLFLMLGKWWIRSTSIYWRGWRRRSRM